VDNDDGAGYDLMALGLIASAWPGLVCVGVDMLFILSEAAGR
jgi:hypothetical protein